MRFGKLFYVFKATQMLVLLFICGCTSTDSKVGDTSSEDPPLIGPNHPYQEPVVIGDSEPTDSSTPRQPDATLASGTVNEAALTSRFKGREAFLVSVIGAQTVPLNATAKEDVNLLKTMSAAYAKAGYRVHTFATIQSLAPVDVSMANVANAYKRKAWKLEAVVLHLVGHGSTNHWCCLPLSPAGRVRATNYCSSHFDIGKAVGDAFPSTSVFFKGTQFLGVFDACRQGKATKSFPRGLRAGSQPMASGFTTTSTNDGEWGVGDYTQGYSMGLTKLATGNFANDINAAHAAAKSYLKGKRLERQSPKIEAF